MLVFVEQGTDGHDGHDHGRRAASHLAALEGSGLECDSDNISGDGHDHDHRRRAATCGVTACGGRAVYSTKKSKVFSGLKLTDADASDVIVLVTATGYSKALVQRIPIAESFVKDSAANNVAGSTVAAALAAALAAVVMVGSTSGALVWYEYSKNRYENHTVNVIRTL